MLEVHKGELYAIKVLNNIQALPSHADLICHNDGLFAVSNS